MKREDIMSNNKTIAIRTSYLPQLLRIVEEWRGTYMVSSMELIDIVAHGDNAYNKTYTVIFYVENKEIKDWLITYCIRNKLGFTTKEGYGVDTKYKQVEIS
jgi:hypothetical protein